MVRDLLASDPAMQDNVVMQIMCDIHLQQSCEIVRMEQLLAARAGAEVR